MQVRGLMLEKQERREEEVDTEVEGRVRRKEAAGEKGEGFEGRRTLDEEISVVVEAKEAMD